MEKTIDVRFIIYTQRHKIIKDFSLSNLEFTDLEKQILSIKSTLEKNTSAMFEYTSGDKRSLCVIIDIIGFEYSFKIKGKTP